MQLDTASTFSDLALPSRPATAPRPRLQRKGVTGQDVAHLTAQLAIMIRSGVDIATALQSAARQCKRPALAQVLHDIHEGVIGGRSFSEALRQYPHIFNAAYVATVAAGEASGHMADVLDQLASLQRNQLRLTRTIRGMLVYPVLLLCVSTLVIGVLLVMVLPRFAELFADYEMSLPWITEVLIAVADELRYRWWVWIPLGIAMMAGAVALPATQAGRRVWDRFLLQAPLLSDVSRALLIGRSCRLIGMMMHSGVTLLDSVKLARKSTRNWLFQQLFAEIEEAVVNGRSFASALTASTLVPAAATEMLTTAEQAGKLADVAQMIGGYFEEEGEAKARQLVTAIEPMITVVMGLVVTTVVLAVMLPVFDLSTFAGGGGP